METLLSGFSQAIRLIFSFDRELYSIVFLSLKVSGGALLLAAFIGLPVGSVLGLKKFHGRDFIISLLNAFMGLPPVVVGLVLYLILSRSGPLGFMGILYSPSAMIIAQTLLAVPIIAALSHSSIIAVDDIVRKSALTLGATPLQAAIKVIAEARDGIMAALIAALGRVIAEGGAILIVGGNIAGYTRVMTTTIALETDKGNFELAIALGVVLIFIALCINVILHWVRKKGL